MATQRIWRTQIGDDLRLLPEHFHDHGYFTARVGKIGHNTFEHAISWDVSKFALSREPEQRFHVPGYLPGIDLSEVRDNTWTKGSEDGMSRADVLAASGRRGGLPLSWRATTESPRMTPDGTTATRIIQLLAENRDKPFFIAAGFHKPHQPWVGPATFFAQHPVDKIQLPKTPPGDTEDIPDPAFKISKDDASHTDRQKKQAIAAYHAMVTMTDSYVGQLLDALKLLRVGRFHHRCVHQRSWLPPQRAWRPLAKVHSVRRVDARAADRALAQRSIRGSGCRWIRRTGRPLSDTQSISRDFRALRMRSKVQASSHYSKIRIGTGSRRRSRNTSVRATTDAPFARNATATQNGRRYRAPMARLCGSSTTLRKTPFEYDNLAITGAHDALVAELSRRLEAGWRAALP